MTPPRSRRRAKGLATILGVAAIALTALGPAQATTPLGAQTQISVTGVDGDATLDATDASVAYNPAANQFLIVWPGGRRVRG